MGVKRLVESQDEPPDPTHAVRDLAHLLFPELDLKGVVAALQLDSLVWVGGPVLGGPKVPDQLEVDDDGRFDRRLVAHAVRFAHRTAGV